MTSTLQTILTVNDLIEVLKVSSDTFNAFSYDNSNVNRYKIVPFKKRDGSYRNMAIPHSTLKMIQRRLLIELEGIYRPSRRSYAYIKGRGIRDNAKAHLQRRNIFSIDLEDFFDQINFGRVRGRLMAPPYNITGSVATAIARITVFQNSLPFGAPTSPILSNMICSGLDAKLSKLGKENASFYTRYADDIVFSSQKNTFSNKIVRTVTEGGTREVVAGIELEEIITASGFRINKNKTKLKTVNDSHTICGVVCNEKLNARLKLRREIRALLHSWQKFGKSKVQEFWVKKFGNSEEKDFERVLRGKIEFIRYIRGDDDLVVWKMVDRFNALTEGKQITYDLPAYLREGVAPVNWRVNIDKSVCVVFAESSDIKIKDAVSRQGTGFAFGKGLILTNAHVACYSDGKSVEKLTVMFSHIRVALDVELVDVSISLDIAVIRVKDLMWEFFLNSVALNFDFSNDYEGDKPVTLAGYPNYTEGDTVHIVHGHITGTSTVSGSLNKLKVFRISENIIYGNSGGPVFNSEGKVLGVAVCGSGISDAPYTVHNAAIPSNIFESFLVNLSL